MALAQEPKSNAIVPSAEAPFEWQVVSTASRKMLEVQRETDTVVKADVPQFLQIVATKYPGKPLMYGAMSDAGGAMTGQGPAAPSTYQTMYHVTSASSFYNYNVSDDWKKMTAAKLSTPGQPPVDWQSPEVFEAWKVAVTDGQDIPAEMTLPDSTGLLSLAWVSPDPRMVRPSSSNRLQGNDDFFAMCHLLALAPEWYADGLVNVHYDELNQTMIRPVSFDGMLSPLWVQRPPNQSAATGGGAVEALNKDAVRLSAMGPAQAYIVTREMTKALKQAATEWPVDAYSEDLNKVAKGDDPAVTLLGQEQASIVEEVRRSRRAADAAFREQTAPPSAVPSAAVVATAAPSTRIAMTKLPLPTGQSNLASREALTEEMVAWAKRNHIQNRGQRFPAERFREEAKQSPAAAQAIIEAATVLLRNSDDPAVLQLVAQLGPDTSYRPFYEALLNRLEAKRHPLRRAGAADKNHPRRPDASAERSFAGDRSETVAARPYPARPCRPGRYPARHGPGGRPLRYACRHPRRGRKQRKSRSLARCEGGACHRARAAGTPSGSYRSDGGTAGCDARSLHADRSTGGPGLVRNP